LFCIFLILKAKNNKKAFFGDFCVILVRNIFV